MVENGSLKKYRDDEKLDTMKNLLFLRCVWQTGLVGLHVRPTVRPCFLRPEAIITLVDPVVVAVVRRKKWEETDK